MKVLLGIILLVGVLTGCQENLGVMSTTEQSLVGYWNHDSTVINGITSSQICNSPFLDLKAETDNYYSEHFEADQGLNCTHLDGWWYVDAQGKFVLAGAIYDIVSVTQNNLVIVNGYDQYMYFSKY